MKALLVIFTTALLSGCSIFGDNNVESAPYTLLKEDTEQNIEIRNYESMILVTTSMSGDGQNQAFRKLFKYITGANEGQTQIAMTAPVIMNEESKQHSQEGMEIAMTAPVFMNENGGASQMSFVMPANFTLESTPKPSNPDVKVSEVRNYKVAAIQFNWTLSDSNVETHKKILSEWIAENGYVSAGDAVKAGYNGPLTLPMFRRNEVLIPIQ